MIGQIVGDDVIAGMCRWLRAMPPLAGWVAADTDGGPLIVQDVAPPLDAHLADNAVVLAHAGPLASPVDHGATATRVLVEVWAAPILDADGAPVEPSETRRRVLACWRAFDRVINRPQGGTVAWGGVDTYWCDRLADATTYEVPDTGGVWRAFGFYGVGHL